MGTSECINFENGIKAWYRNGKCHREDGPAIELENGTRLWCQNGKRHREDGPAGEYASGTKSWYINGKLHREDGPAIERADGTREWYRKGYPYGIVRTKQGICIGCKTTPTVGEWDEWFSGTEEYENPRNSPEFKTLLKLWAQFKAQHAK